MDEKSKCLTKTSLKKAYFTKTVTEVLVEPDKQPAAANVELAAKVKLAIVNDLATPENDITITISVELVGHPQAKGSEKEVTFTLDSTLVGIFSLKDGELTKSDATDCMSIFLVQLFPVMRQHIVSLLTGMNVGVVDAPWDIGLGDLSEHLREKAHPKKNRASKKKLSK